MLSYEFYKVLHVLGILVLFGALGGLAGLRLGGASTPAAARTFNVLHGIALGLVLLAGFGMLARLGMGSPGTWGAWVWIKLVVWLLLGAGLAAVKRAGAHAGNALLVLTLLGAVAAWAAIFKPAF